MKPQGDMTPTITSAHYAHAQIHSSNVTNSCSMAKRISNVEQDCDQPLKKKHLSLSRKKSKSNERFSFISSSSGVEAFKTKIVPKNTDKATQWTVKIYTEWSKARKDSGRSAPLDGLLLTNSSKEVFDWLCTFFSEVRKSNGEPYCPRSLGSILAGLSRYIETYSEYKVKIQNAEGEFKSLHTLSENLYKKLHADGIGTSSSKADIITNEEEERLWNSEVLNDKTPESLLNAIFYYNGLNFVLRGGREHRNLSLAQLEFGCEPDPDSPDQMLEFVDYVEHGSKN